MDKRILEVLNHLLALLIYAFLLSKNIASECFSLFDSVITLINVIISISLMFYLWGVD